MSLRRFAPHGMLALMPQAFNQTYDLTAPQAMTEPAEECEPWVAIVQIRGPLLFHYPPPKRDPYEPREDCYDDIRCRVQWAFASGACAVLLDCDSPGGLVSGCFETAQAIRELAVKFDKPLYAYISGNCTSACYALACVADKIITSATAIVGSIGVINCVLDATSADEKQGLKFTLISSGARKADSNPHQATSDETINAEQQRVDETAEIFFEHVAAHRSTLSVESVRALNADTYTGVRAESLQLVDSVGTLDTVIAELLATAKGLSTMASYKSSKEALIAEAESDDPKVRATARKALVAMYSKDGDEPGEHAETETETETETDSEDDKKKKDEEAKAAAAARAPQASSAVAPAAQAVVAAMSAEDRRILDEADARNKREKQAALAAERKSLLASRPDLDDATRAIFADPRQTPIVTLRALVVSFPKMAAQGAGVAAALAATPGAAAVPGQASAAVVPAGAGAGAAAGTPTQGAPEGGGPKLSNFSGAGDDLDRRMGLNKTTESVIYVQDGVKYFSQTGVHPPNAPAAARQGGAL